MSAEDTSDDPFHRDKLRVTPEMMELMHKAELAQQEADYAERLARLREQQKNRPPTSHADRKRYWPTIPWVTRLMVRRRAKGRCEDCGQVGWNELHHLHYQSLGMELPSDLIALCNNCHHRRHWKTGRFVLEPN
jgi:5-methylcytosine-specific restriction endonuclease McrA